MSDLSAAVPDVGARPQASASRGSKAPDVLAGAALLGLAGAVGVAFGHDGSTARFAGNLLVLDATSRLFVLLVNLAFFGVATHLWTRAASRLPRAGLARYTVAALAFVAVSNLAIFSNNLLTFWCLLELTTFVALPLIQHGGGATAFAASWRYFLFSCVGLAVALLGFGCLARSTALATGGEVTFALDTLAREVSPSPDAWWRLGLTLVVLGLGTKLGLAPMYAWLPETYEAAPAATTALLGAVQFNVALVGLFRVLSVARLVEPSRVHFELIAMGLATMVISAFSIVVARRYMRLIAHASLSHAGVIAIGLGAGGEAAYGVVVYAASNAMIKVVLILSAGRIRAHYQTDEIREVSALVRDLPYSGLFFMIGTFALLGLPPSGSFQGELMIMSGLVGGGQFAVFVAFCAVLTVTFVAAGRALFPMIWGESRGVLGARSSPGFSIFPKVVLLAALVGLGVYVPAPVSALLRQVASTLGAP